MNSKLGMHTALAGLALLAVTALPASAQSARLGWTPWIGCWQTDDGPEGSALCIRPSDRQDGAVEILGIEDGQIQEREVVWADGRRHETIRDACSGWEQGRFSEDGRRILLSSSHTCEDGLVQEGGGIMAMATPREWLDVRYVQIADEPTAWVQRYRPAPAEVARAAGLAELADRPAATVLGARTAAAQRLDVGDVIEASAVVPGAAVEAWVAEKGDALRLDADGIVAMADAGVPDRVVDVVVAVSNPDVFRLAQGEPERLQVDGRDRAARRGYRGRFGMGVYSPWRYYRSPYAYGWSPFGYSGWGYGYLGGTPYGGGYGYRPIVIVERRDEDNRRSRVIAGRGYSGGGGGGGAARPSRGSGDGARSGGGSSAAPSSRPSTSRPEPTPRKAKPRRPGGDDRPGGAG